MNQNSHKSSSDYNVRLEQLTSHALSAPARFWHVGLLLAALAMSIILIALLVTEPAIPMRTRIAFAVMLAMSLSWMAYSIWVLKNRLTLLANHRIVAGKMAVAFTAIFTVSALATGFFAGKATGFLAAGMGAALLVIALGLLARAKRRFAILHNRRQQLERELAGEKT
ncbi:MAG TPA: hypothetical protein PLF92_07615 [Arenimonas sp.]|nr:hypothetical protein [Arenimonas sp.]HOZ03959.1 hypothetical protein [Arenimonas sp.]HPO23358.1 hypothetical protein [Arenimonas sp.]HPW32761.1 hypothetical protein [Arenimonas sp.]